MSCVYKIIFLGYLLGIFVVFYYSGYFQMSRKRALVVRDKVTGCLSVCVSIQKHTDTKHCTDIDILYSKAFCSGKVLKYLGEGNYTLSREKLLMNKKMQHPS